MMRWLVRLIIKRLSPYAYPGYVPLELDFEKEAVRRLFAAGLNDVNHELVVDDDGNVIVGNYRG